MPIHIEHLKARIRSIERGQGEHAPGHGAQDWGPQDWDVQARLGWSRFHGGPRSGPGLAATLEAERSACREGDPAAWTLGEPGAVFEHGADANPVDDMLGPAGLQTAAVHEIKPSPSGVDWPAAWAAARGFALALAGRRLIALDRAAGQPPAADPKLASPAPVSPGMSSAARSHGPMILWCASSSMTHEHGTPYGAGLRALGLDPARLIVVEPARDQDILWVLEQALKSGSLALVMGQLDAVGLTPARRLALAAAHAGTPCLLITHPRAPHTAATATRWRIAPAPSAAHPFDPQAPGRARFGVTLERCRGRPLAAEAVSFMLEWGKLEWCDAAYRFRLVADVADRALAPGRSRRRTARGGAGETWCSEA